MSKKKETKQEETKQEETKQEVVPQEVVPQVVDQEKVLQGSALAEKVVTDLGYDGLIGTAIAGLVNTLKIGELTVLMAAVKNDPARLFLIDALNSRKEGKKKEDQKLPAVLQDHGFDGRYSILNLAYQTRSENVKPLIDALNDQSIDFAKIITALFDQYVYIR